MGTEKTSEYTHRYWTLIASRKQEEALELMHEMIRRFGQAGAEAMLDASAQMEASSLDISIVALQHLTEAAPAFAKGWANLGGSLFTSGRLGEAIAASKRAIELDPTDEKPWNNYGAAAAKQGNLRQAYECFYQAFTIAPEKKKSQENLTRCAVHILRAEGMVIPARAVSLTGRMPLPETDEYRELMKPIMDAYPDRNWQRIYDGMIPLMVYVEKVIRDEVLRGDHAYVIHCLLEKAHLYSGLADTEACIGRTDDALKSLEAAGALLDTFGNHPLTTHGRVMAQYTRICKQQGEDPAAEARAMGRMMVTCPTCKEETVVPHEFEQFARLVKAKGYSNIPTMLNITTNCMHCGSKFSISDLFTSKRY